MSFVPSQYLVRLQELKLWQGNYDNLLQKQKIKSFKETDLSDLDGLDGVTPLSEHSPRQNCSAEPVDWDQQTILPTKPFNELLEEKLAEEKPYEATPKIKQPFLKKGAGLARYKIDPNNTTNKNTKKAKYPKALSRSTDTQDLIQKNKINNEQNSNSITPLKAPDLSVQCKATWNKANNEEEHSLVKEQVNRFNPHYVIEKINKFAQSFCSPKKCKDSKDLPSQTPDHCAKESSSENSFSNKSEKELQLFETLEEKVDHSSFLSTNTSIARLLASTPSRTHNSPNHKPSNEDLNVCQELRSSDVLTKILNNLKLIAVDSTNGHYLDNHSRKSSNDTSSSEDKKSYKNESVCQTSSSFYSEFENTLGKLEKINTSVNTSFAYKNEDGCSNCADLQKKIEKLLHETSSIAIEKAKLYDYGKDLEQKCDSLARKFENLKKNYDKDVEDLRQELEEEKQKFAREKAILDMYIKDVRPKKRDCMDMDNLKKEVIELKEILKLKETKNGTTQARLRNQIKQLEKDKNELKSSVELLQKENAKLSASQKVNRNAEARMLQEISRNLNKLTEETVRAEIVKSDLPNNSTGDRLRSQKKIRLKGMGELKGKVEKELQIQDCKVKREVFSPVDNKEKEAPSVEMIYNNGLVDKPLESYVGLADRECSTYDGVNQVKKVLMEREFPDGSKEIKYVNGTSKTVSPDGKLIYLQYSNGDIRETNLINNMQKYFFAKNNIWLTKFSDGTEVIDFPNGQKEERFTNGKIQVTTPDGTTVINFPEGMQQIYYPDGSKMIKENQEKIIYLPNGQKETHTPNFKKREYPDGTVKIIYPDGTQESRYANGRIRIKDEHGTLIMDSHIK